MEDSPIKLSVCFLTLVTCVQLQGLWGLIIQHLSVGGGGLVIRTYACVHFVYLYLEAAMKITTYYSYCIS